VRKIASSGPALPLRVPVDGAGNDTSAQAL